VSGLPAALLPAAGRRSALPWLSAAVTFLMVLAAAASLALGRATDAIAGAAANRATLAIAETEPARRAATLWRVRTLLAEDKRVLEQSPVDDARARRLLAMTADDATALPMLLDLRLAPGTDVATLTPRLSAVANVRVRAHGEALTPLGRLISALRGLALAMLAVAVGLGTMAAMLVARAMLGRHRVTIEVLHDLGATDRQIARLVERRTGVEAFAGALLGLLLAAAAILPAASRIAAIAEGKARPLSPLDWGLLVLLPLAISFIAMLAARVAVLRQLAQAG
jgi:cell division transport system permease protein